MGKFCPRLLLPTIVSPLVEFLVLFRCYRMVHFRIIRNGFLSQRLPLSLSLSALSIIVYSSVLGNASIVCIDRRRICSLVNKYKMIIYYQARINNHRYQSVPVYAKLTHSSLQSLYHSLHFLNKI